MHPALIAVPAVAGLGFIGKKLGWFGYKITPPLVQNLPDHPRLDPVAPPKDAPMPQPVIIGTTPAGNPVRVLVPVNPDTGKATVVNTVATTGNAIDAAHKLFDYLKASGITATADLVTLVKEFQTAHNTDPNAKSVAGKLEVNGKYDAATAGALTVYMGEPISPDPKLPAPASTTYAGSPYALSSSNLYAYLKVHGNDKSATMKPLVKAFQHDVNTDKTFPGPANPTPAFRVIKVKLVEDGLYGKATSDALACCTFERINP